MSCGRMNAASWSLLVATGLTACTAVKQDRAPAKMHGEEMERQFYLPNAEASQVVSVTKAGQVRASILVQTRRAAVKETGPKETVARFGEVYAFSPNFFAVHREEPTQIRFWNLQPDDQHDFMLVDPEMHVLMSVLLPPLQETSYVFTFHKEGLFNFYCAMHPPGMAGQILVLPPRAP
jgi:plastocyanin